MSTSPGADLTGLTAGAMRLVGRPDPSLPQWWRTMRWMLGMQAYLAAWFWGIILALEVLVLFAVSAVGEVSLSFLQFAVHGALWFPFAIMIGIAGAQITTHVAAGMTRRSFSRAALGTAAVLALGYGLLLSAGMVGEGVLYEAMGWPHVHVANVASPGTGVLEPWTHGFLPAWFMYAVRTFSGAVAGLLVGIAYYRFGAWKGTALLPLTALPALLGQDFLADLIGQGTGLHPVALAAISLVVPLLGALAVAALTRAVPLTTTVRG
ncbi:hypothetical protein IM660_07430 [Ruania alkalisoli]|uniref:Uncharacterized protein n=1 Tax=Ruania alkalisoli TaxID=2779775 RepID=A0A7M1SYL3_9MICO|nr:hypothetical protein [Ruania alkalisoli]QOR72064.1 hypothetical protein IM660_07430 [Ruania alkalisoli]